MKIYDDLPELYRAILPEFFEQEVPVEENATCNDCAMCQKPGETAIPGVEYYRPDVKCCSYYPKLPNYLVGGLLADTNPALDEGRRRIRDRIQSRVAVAPQALFIPKRYSLLHKYGMPQSYGRVSSMLCPYYIKEGGLCSIWKFRDAVCSTYFCKTMAGKEGVKFWKVLRAYLNQTQETLSWYALYKLNWDVESIWDYLNNLEAASLQIDDLDEIAPPEESYKKIWKDWVGKEEEFYRECFNIVSTLTREDFDRLSGINEKVILNWLKEKHNNVMSPKIPRVLRKNPEMLAYPMPDGASYGIKTDVGFFTILAALHDVLNLFDGAKTIDEIRKLVFEKYEDELSDELLLSLYFNRMVLPT
jgi:Fe-S-cluster containining protein